MYIILIISLIILTIVLWFAAIIDITRSRFKEPYINTISLLAVLFFPVLGSIIYFLLKKQLTTKAPKKFQPNFNTNEISFKVSSYYNITTRDIKI